LLTEDGERRIGPMVSHCVLDIGESCLGWGCFVCL